MKTIFTTIFLVPILSPVFGQTVTVLTEPPYFPTKPGLTVIHKTELKWSPRPLNWNCYRIILDTTVTKMVGTTKIKAKAVTTTGITADFQCSGNELYYDVRAMFSIKWSWFLKASQGDTALLRHEQMHFNITELYARKIRKLLTEYKQPCGKEKEIRIKINSLIQAEIEENNLYDIESVHYTNKVMQKKWEEKIKKELEETKTYINPKCKVAY